MSQISSAINSVHHLHLHVLVFDCSPYYFVERHFLIVCAKLFTHTNTKHNWIENKVYTHRQQAHVDFKHIFCFKHTAFWIVHTICECVRSHHNIIKFRCWPKNNRPKGTERVRKRAKSNKNRTREQKKNGKI